MTRASSIRFASGSLRRVRQRLLRLASLWVMPVATMAAGCSAGATPREYRAPLEGNGGGPNRCSAPDGCFDTCFCAGQAVAECETACGASGAPSSGTGGASSVGGTPAVGGQASAGGTSTGGAAGAVCTPALPDATTAEFSCDPNGALACSNCGDCRQIIDGSAKAAASTCGVQCGGSRSCAAGCLSTSTTLSAPCSECLLDFFDCLVANCLASCLGTTPDACSECARTKPATGETCSAALEKCSGAKANH